MIQKDLTFSGIKPFDIMIRHVNQEQILSDIHDKNSESNHVHPQCEIYVNLTGNVSFMVENKVYPVTHGNAIISMPYEYHHCIYNDSTPHEHFWILFSSDGNEELFPMFFERIKGEGNLISLSEKHAENLIQICYMLMEDKPVYERYELFFALISLLSKKEEASPQKQVSLPADLQKAIEYIQKNLSYELSIEQVAKHAHVSINTLERHFSETLGVSPSQFIRTKRLANAARLLKEGKNVIEACMESGFSDCSYFISLFRKNFGITPYKYKNQNKQKG